MSSSVLRDKSEAFSVRIVACCRVLRERKVEYSLIDQLLRAGTSVGANIAEAQFAHGKKDFVARLEIALKEINETGFWIERLFNGGYLTEREFKSMRSDSIAIKKVLLSSIKTVKNQLNSEKTK